MNVRHALLCVVVLASASSAQTSRVSVGPGGAQATSGCQAASISSNGRFVAFHSDAPNLVSGDTNGFFDVFVYDRQTSATSRVSVGPGGAQANINGSNFPSISGDGRYVAFWSTATNLVPGDTNDANDIFVHDRQTSTTTRVSIGPAGIQSNNISLAPSISSDGRYVAFVSAASNLVVGDVNGTFDIFVHDRQTSTTTRVSVGPGGAEPDSDSFAPVISADGRYVAFRSDATNLVPEDTNTVRDVFVHDRQTGVTSRESVSSAGVPANDASLNVSISGDGRFVAFESAASNLVAGDTNGGMDIFVRDRQSGTTSRASLASVGTQGNGSSNSPAISVDGRYVAFQSAATNLVAADTNNAEDTFVRDRQTGVTTRVSVGAGSAQSNDRSDFPSISGDGRYIAFQSLASNLVAADTNGAEDVFVHDRLFTSPCPGDADGSRTVNFADITSILLNFNNVYAPGVTPTPGDADGSRTVNFADITSVLLNFNNSCA